MGAELVDYYVHIKNAEIERFQPRSPTGSSANTSKCSDARRRAEGNAHEQVSETIFRIGRARHDEHAAAADVIKVGVIGTMSGPYALFGQNFKMGIDAWIAQNGSKIGDHQVEFIYRDEEGPIRPSPRRWPRSDRQGQGALSRRHLLHAKRDGGRAAAGGIQDAADRDECRHVVDRREEPLYRAHVVHDVAEYRACREGRQEEWRQEGRDRGQRLRAGIDAEAAFKKTFEAEGGTIAEAIRMPLNTTDFSPIMQRIRDSGADTIFTFLPAGPPTLAS